MQKSNVDPKMKRKGRYSKDSNDNFFVKRDKFMIVKQFKEKIERMFEIQLGFEDPVDDGQWLNLQGDQGDRRNAKNYINALIQPDERQQVKFPDETCKEFTNLEKLELIEKQTTSVIKPLKNIAEFEICGTDLAVTLALSMLEGIAGNMQQKNVIKDGESSDNTFLSPTCASERLYTSLQRALSDHSDGACSINEYVKAPEAVKRVLVECIEDEEIIEDDLLFADGELRKNAIDLTHDGEMDTDGVDGKLADKLKDTAISKIERTPAFSKQQEYLKTFGATVGYKPHEVSEALNFVDERTRPSDFLDILRNLEQKKEALKSDSDDDDDVIVLETSTVDLIDGKPVETVVDLTNTVETSDNPKNITTHIAAGSSPYKRDLPESYKERLIRDFMQEDQNCSVEELKRRNAERQTMLKQTFQRQLDDNSTIGCDNKKQTQSYSEKNADNCVKPKSKGASGKKQKQSSKITETSKRNNQTHQTPCEARYQNDLDQTCVMRPWVPEEQSKQITCNKEENEWTTPKRRKPQISSMLSAHIPEGKSPKQHSQSPNRAQSDFKRNQEAPQSTRVQYAEGGKPIQIVSPTNVASERRPLLPLSANQDMEELKYIVIDGTNVALTHGKSFGSFSSKRIQICVDFFKKRGHENITVFLPRWRKKGDDAILQQLQDEGILTLTPSRKIEGKYISSYDDRFILRLAEEENGVIVSNDNFRDIMDERANWKRLVHNSLLMFCFVGDHFMPPDDPLGRDGPTLDEFLRKPKQHQDDRSQELQQQQQVPFHLDHPDAHIHVEVPGAQGHHPSEIHYRTDFHVQSQEQGQRWPLHGQRQNVTDIQTYTPTKPQNQERRWNTKRQGHTKVQGKQYEPRSDAESEGLYQELKVIFPEHYQEDTLRNVLANHPCETDLTKLTNYCMSVLFP